MKSCLDIALIYHNVTLTIIIHGYFQAISYILTSKGCIFTKQSLDGNKTEFLDKKGYNKHNNSINNKNKVVGKITLIYKDVQNA